MKILYSKIRVTIITCPEDIASQTIREQLLSLFDFKLQSNIGKWNSSIVKSLYKYSPKKTEIPIVFSLIDVDPNISMIRLDDHLTPDEMHGDFLIFASKHQSKSERPALLCHSPGNLNSDNSVGGEPYKIAKGSGLLSHYCFHYLTKLVQEKKDYDVPINHEVTHHGPTRFHQPCVFIELGSTIKGWKSEIGGKIVAQALINASQDLVKNHYKDGQWDKNNNIKICIGFGGGHYMPSFSQILMKNYGFAHTVPKYKAMDLTSEMVQQIIDRTFEKVDYWVIDWKGLKSAERLHVLSILEEFDNIPYKKSKELRKN